MAEQALGEMVRSGHTPTFPEADRQSLVHTQFVADTAVQSVLSSTGFIVPLAEIVSKLLYRAVDEHCIRHIKGA